MRSRGHGICDAPREHDRADDRAVGHERRGDRVAQAVGAADARGDAVGDLLARCSCRSGPSTRRTAPAPRPRPPDPADLCDGPRRHDREPIRLPRRRDRRDGLAARSGSRRVRRATRCRSADRSIRSSRSETGRIVVESGTPGRELTRVASRTRESGRRRATTTWSAPVAARELLDDRVDDGVGRHRARQARQDPGERLGLGSPLGFERRRPPRDGTIAAAPADHDQREHEPVEQAARVDDEAVRGDQAEGDEDAGETHHDRWIRGSCWSVCGGEVEVGLRTFGMEHARPARRASMPRRGTPRRDGPVLPY